LVVRGAGEDEISVLLGEDGGGFRAPTASPVADAPASLAVGDFDADGRVDVAVAHDNADSLSLLFGRGDGGFGAPTSVPVAPFPLPSPLQIDSAYRSSVIAAGDFNHDGDPDLAVGYVPEGELVVLIGAPGGRFEAPRRLGAVGSNYSKRPALTIGDVNADGNSDLAFSGSDDVSVLLGRGDGRFSSPRTFTGGARAINAIAIGDLDGDHSSDLALASNFPSEGVSLLAGRGSGRFRGPAHIKVSGDAASIALVDLNGDRDLDLAVPDSRGVSIVLNRTHWCLGRRVTRLAGPSGRVRGTAGPDVIIGSEGPDVIDGGGGADRICGRGRADILKGGRGRDQVAGEQGDDHLIGASGDDRLDGGLGADRISGGPGNDLVRAAGTRRDRVDCGRGHDRAITDRRDRARHCERAGPVPSISFRGPLYLQVGHDSDGRVTVADFNRDRDPDLAVMNRDYVSIRLGASGTAFGRERRFRAGSHFAESAAVEDLNSDGNLDLAITDSSSASVAVLLGDGSGRFDAPRTVLEREGPCCLGGDPPLAVGDLDRDGSADLVLAGHNELLVLAGDGAGGFDRPTNLSLGDAPAAVGVSDFNADGRPDLAVADAFSGQLSIVPGQPTGPFGPPVSFDVGRYPRSLVIGDFNKDADADLAVGTGWVSVALGSAGNRFRAPRTFPVRAGPLSQGDFNSDGQLDLVAVAEDRVVILTADGRGGLHPAIRFPILEAANAVAVGDFDRDGKPDVVLVSHDIYENGNVALLVNTTPAHPSRPR
jgi:hypothetical protein